MRTVPYKLALLTGGSSGIGLAAASELVRSGTSVILIARRTEMLKKAEETLKQTAADGVQIFSAALDVSDRESVRSVLTECLDRCGTPDFLYCGAGTAQPGHFEHIPDSVFDQMIQTNTAGMWNVLRVVIPRMKQAGRGTVVNVSSLAGFVGTYGYTAYAASKFAVTGLTQCLRNELKPDGIDVRLLCPPDTDTPQLEQEEQTKPEETRKISGNAGVLTPEKVARDLMKALKRKHRFMILPGIMAKVTWHVSRFFPGLLNRIIDRDVRIVRNSSKGKKPVPYRRF